MDPKAVLKGLKGAKETVETGVNAADKIVDMVERVKDGKAERFCKLEGNKLQMLQGKAGVVFDSLSALTTAGEKISGIVNAQRESKANTTKVYSDIANKQRELDANIANTRSRLEQEMEKATAEIRHQEREDALASQKLEQEHEARMLELQMKYDTAVQEHRDAHELKMIELSMQKEKNDAEIQRMAEETRAIKLQNDRYEKDTAILYEARMSSLASYKHQLDIMNELLEQSDLTSENMRQIAAERDRLLLPMQKLNTLELNPEG